MCACGCWRVAHNALVELPAVSRTRCVHALRQDSLYELLLRINHTSTHISHQSRDWLQVCWGFFCECRAKADLQQARCRTWASLLYACGVHNDMGWICAYVMIVITFHFDITAGLRQTKADFGRPENNICRVTLRSPAVCSAAPSAKQSGTVHC